MDKKLVRKEVSARIAAMTDAEKREKSAVIAAKVADFGFCGKRILVYNSLSDEVDTSRLISELAKENEVYLPVVVSDSEMMLAAYDGNWKTGAYGIKEPTGERLTSGEVRPDVCITPLRAFDENLNRVGRGKGYYDRFFASCDCTKIAIAFECQKVDAVQTDENDIKADCVITERAIYGK